MSEEGDPTPLDLTLHATDAENDTLRQAIQGQAQHGTAEVMDTGPITAVTYNPETDYCGDDAFAVRVSDGNSSTD